MATLIPNTQKQVILVHLKQVTQKEINKGKINNNNKLSKHISSRILVFQKLFVVII